VGSKETLIQELVQTALGARFAPVCARVEGITLILTPPLAYSYRPVFTPVLWECCPQLAAVDMSGKQSWIPKHVALTQPLKAHVTNYLYRGVSCSFWAYLSTIIMDVFVHWEVVCIPATVDTISILYLLKTY